MIFHLLIIFQILSFNPYFSFSAAVEWFVSAVTFPKFQTLEKLG